ncbi:MAG: hypothetical protein COT85_01340 [Chlamydiae bacterium CG10_big_fil_rev_8_21_14_0_10_42_34]|nr:MAG: hypothetical protein COT85_01340 [Chlamydiae bacterium CG10_big_fil_rev_8_21_14_0_10_42_34]
MSIATLFSEVEKAFNPLASCCSKGLTFKEDDGCFLLEAVIPGVKADQVDIKLEKGSICIEAKSDKYRYSYQALLPSGEIDESAAPEASLEDGILRIQFPKAKQAKPLKITVKQQ